MSYAVRTAIPATANLLVNIRKIGFGSVVEPLLHFLQTGQAVGMIINFAVGMFV